MTQFVANNSGDLVGIPAFLFFMLKVHFQNFQFLDGSVTDQTFDFITLA
jgi:hypothetical protein